VRHQDIIIIIIVIPSPQSVSSTLHIKSLFQAMSYAWGLKVCIPYCTKDFALSSSMHQISKSTTYDVPKITTISCHHELHKSSPTNTSASIQVSAKRSLQDASTLHVVGMLHSCSQLHPSIQPLMYPIQVHEVLFIICNVPSSSLQPNVHDYVVHVVHPSTSQHRPSSSKLQYLG